MSLSIEEIQNQLRLIVETQVFARVNEQIGQTDTFLQQVADRAEKLISLVNRQEEKEAIPDQKILDGLSAHNVAMMNYLKEAKTFFQNQATAFPGFFEQTRNLIAGLEPIRKEVQLEERFSPDENDSLPIGIIKGIKRASRLFKKKRTHSIPLQNFTEYFAASELGSQIVSIKEETAKLCCEHSFDGCDALSVVEKHLISLLTSSDEEGPDLDQAKILDDINTSKKRFSERSNELRSEFEKNLDGSLMELKEDYHKVGTIELPNSRFADLRVIGAVGKFENRLAHASEGWFNTWQVLVDEWLLLAELNSVLFFALNSQRNLPAAIEKHISDNVIPGFDDIEVEITNTRAQIEDFLEEDFVSNLKEEREQLAQKLKSELIPNCKKTLVNGEATKLVQSATKGLLEKVASLQEKRAVAEGSDFDRRISNSSIELISAKELLDVDATPVLQRTGVLLGDKLEEAAASLKAELADINQVTDFGLESAITSEGEVNTEESKKISLDGLSRAVEKINVAKASLKAFTEYTDKQLKELVDRLSNDISRISQTDKILDLKLWMIRSKAEKKTLDFYERLREPALSFIPNLIQKIKKLGYLGGESFTEITDRFRLIPKETTISAEVTSFLSETEKSIELLPFVYKRLFKIEPIEDQLFFQGRNAELLELGNAYNSWLQERFAPIAIIGEKISGSTSVINNFFKNTEKRHEVLRCRLPNPVFEEEHFFKVMADAFNYDGEFERVSDVINYANELPAKKIVVLEDLEHLFLKKVNGFDSMKYFLEIMSKTNKKIFWVNTCGLYSWNYLNKTIHIADYYGYLVVLGKLKDEQIIDIIKKRHRVSGYKLFFQPQESDLQSKKFKRLAKEEQQENLELRYFSELNNFAQSNIGLALLFWLRSASVLSDNTISIKSIVNQDLSFLNAMEMSKVFTLHALLIHDGLTIDTHSMVLNQSLADSRLGLTVLLEDGLVHENEGLYSINPLIYRQTVSLLKDKNLLH